MTMQFSLNSCPVTLKGLSPMGLTMEDASHFLRSPASAHWPSGPIRELLQQFDQVFAEPTGLPPPRTQDHQILLKSDQPVSVRPYHYLYFQKSKIEKIVKDLLLFRGDPIQPEPLLLPCPFSPQA
jgi:hypothetical protein